MCAYVQPTIPQAPTLKRSVRKSLIDYDIMLLGKL